MRVARVVVKGAISTTRMAAWPLVAGIAEMSAASTYKEANSKQALQDLRALVDATASLANNAKRFLTLG